MEGLEGCLGRVRGDRLGVAAVDDLAQRGDREGVAEAAERVDELRITLVPLRHAEDQEPQRGLRPLLAQPLDQVIPVLRRALRDDLLADGADEVRPLGQQSVEDLFPEERLPVQSCPEAQSALATAGDVGMQIGQAMRFPSNVGNGTPPGDTSLAVLRYDNPHSNGLPFRGPGGAGLTVIYWVKTRAQTGYYVNWWWGPGDGSFYFDADDVPYVGGHLYPTSGDNNGTSHEYEIAIRGGDFRATLAGTNQAAVHGVWRKQAIRLTVNGDGTVTVRYYLNLPSVANADIIERTEPATYGTSQRVGVASTFIFGDSPWYLNYQHECLSGSLRAAKIMAADIGQSDMLAEAADMNQMATAAGEAAVWWMKPGFQSLTDLTCPYTSRAFTRVDSGDLLTLESV